MFHFSRSKHVDFAKVYEKAVSVYHDLPPVKKRRRRSAIFILAKITVIFFLLSLVLIIIIGAGNFVKVKMIYQETMAGKEAAEYAVTLVRQRDYDTANYFADIAQDNFNAAVGRLYAYQENIAVKSVPYLADQFKDLVYLLTAANVLSRAINEISGFGQSLDGILNKNDVAFTDLDKAEKTAVLKTIYEAEPALKEIKVDLEASLMNLGQISYSGVLWPARSRIVTLENSIKEASEFMEQALPATRILPPLLGFPNKATYLVMLQNSDELRPTGGFLGTYGILEITSGDIDRFETHDIYHMDMPVKDKVKVTPPAPLVKYLGVNNWYMRDANWSPHWPETAEKIDWFYHEENRFLSGKDQINDFSGDFNGIIGITPEFITDLLALTGPVVIDNEEYSQDNFMQLLEYRVEQGYTQLGIPSWHRKEVIGDIVKELKSRLFRLSPAELYENFNIVYDNLQKKNILLYFKDETLQKYVQSQNWGGEIKEIQGDYLLVVDANMASLKTDAVINRSVNYTVTEGQGGILSDLTVNYAHQGDFDWRTTRYRTYVRVYAPPDSHLISAEGVSEGDVAVTTEFGKTVFSAFVSIEPKKIGTLHLVYKLSDRISEQIAGGRYVLYCQKQPGTKVSKLQIATKFSQPIENYEPIGFYADKADENSLNWETDWQTDKLFTVNFSQ